MQPKAQTAKSQIQSFVGNAESLLCFYFFRQYPPSAGKLASYQEFEADTKDLESWRDNSSGRDHRPVRLDCSCLGGQPASNYWMRPLGGSLQPSRAARQIQSDTDQSDLDVAHCRLVRSRAKRLNDLDLNPSVAIVVMATGLGCTSAQQIWKV